MNRWETLSFHAASLVVSLTGVVYFWMKYFVRNEDPFALVNHPWQQPILKLHILSAPMLILIVGILFKSHFLQKLHLRDKANRRTGLSMLASFPAMVLSGYALQVVAEPVSLKIALVLHIGAGTIFSAACLVHVILGLMLAREEARTWWNKRRLAA